MITLIEMPFSWNQEGVSYLSSCEANTTAETNQRRSNCPPETDEWRARWKEDSLIGINRLRIVYQFVNALQRSLLVVTRH